MKASNQDFIMTKLKTVKETNEGILGGGGIKTQLRGKLGRCSKKRYL